MEQERERAMKQQNSTPVSRICLPSFMHRKGSGNPYLPSTAAHLLFFFLLLLFLLFFSFQWRDMSKIGDVLGFRAPLSCPPSNTAAGASCPAAAAASLSRRPAAAGEKEEEVGSCPEYFRWIHEDLRPWQGKGITREMVEGAAGKASFRLVVVGGRAYVERYGRRTFQTRDVFSQWGIAQLLRRLPGRLPDLELLFDCADHPAVPKAATSAGEKENSTAALFGYCSDDATLDIAFPDWSFWGWPEVNIKPWEPLLEEMKRGRGRVRWVDREPYAYWKGNPWVAGRRQDLLRCNVSRERDWNARLYSQDWITEVQHGFKNSHLPSQCNHRYKIYIEGATWSVSQKYILACDSPTLLVKPQYHDFFSRGLEPLRHYWPVSAQDKCRSIKFAVDWGNTNPHKAQEIGKDGSSYVDEQMKMDHVYDYMFHLLNEYAKLLRFKPTIPPAAVELCPELLACPAKGLEREFMLQSMVRAPREAGPCTLPPPFEPAEMEKLMAERAKSIQQVELWVQDGSESQKTKAKGDN